MATFAAVNNGDGTATLQVRGAVVNCTQVRIGFGTFAYNNSSLDVADTGPTPGTNSYTCSFLNASGGTIGTLSASTTVTFPSPGVSAEVSGPYTGFDWSVSAEGNDFYSIDSADVSYSINGGAYQLYQHYGPTSGASVHNVVFAGYSASVSWRVVVTYRASTTGNTTTTSGAGSGTTAAPPPTPPNPPTNLVATDHGTSVDLSWTGSVGGASGYEISRASTVIGTQSGVTKTDSSPGSNRPLTYSVRAYNSNASGTAYSASIAATVGGIDSCGVLMA